jgi:hypothetical protein
LTSCVSFANDSELPPASFTAGRFSRNFSVTFVGEIAMRNTAVKYSLCLTGLVLLAGATTDASAATVGRTLSQLAPGLCNANNPANQDYLRNLLTGLKNATTVNVSVVCSKIGNDQATSAMSSVFVYFKNEKATSGTVSCTLAAGSPYWGQTNYTKSMTLAAGASNYIGWTVADYGSSTHNQWVNVQCSLPPGWNMQEVGSIFQEEVGA